jgi:hypothetical protein
MELHLIIHGVQGPKCSVTGSGVAGAIFGHVVHQYSASNPKDRLKKNSTKMCIF